MKPENWKTVAIVFIMLFAAETFYMGISMYIGFQMLDSYDSYSSSDDEYDCMSYCAVNLNATRYLYHSGMCRCYDKYGNIISEGGEKP